MSNTRVTIALSRCSIFLPVVYECDLVVIHWFFLSIKCMSNNVQFVFLIEEILNCRFVFNYILMQTVIHHMEMKHKYKMHPI